MRDMNPFGSIFARETLRHGAHGGFGRGKARERRPRAQRGGGTGIVRGALPTRQHPPDGFAPDNEAAQRVLSPKALENLRRQLQQRRGNIAPDIIGNKIKVRAIACLISSAATSASRVASATRASALPVRAGFSVRRRLTLGLRPSYQKDLQPLARKWPRGERTRGGAPVSTPNAISARIFLKRLHFLPLGVQSLRDNQSSPQARSKLKKEIVGRQFEPRLRYEAMLGGGAFSRSTMSFRCHSETPAARSSPSKFAPGCRIFSIRVKTGHR